ncbi:MAG TPA: IS1182 family transposase [Rhizomicrobium sp.]
MSKSFREWNVDQVWLLPPSINDFVPADHVAHFVRDTVRTALDLGLIYRSYRSERGQPPFHPAMMVALLLYAYSQGLYASRRIAKACEERVDFMAVTGMQKPDFRTIAKFRRRHLPALRLLFVESLRLCREAGLVELGHVSLDGTKIKANASKHKAMSYGRMKEVEPVLAKTVEDWMSLANGADDDDDRTHGPDRRGDETPDWMASKQSRLEKIQAAKAALEAEAEAAGNDAPDDEAQRNFTDAESRIQKTKDGFIQGYNAQAAVDHANQIIVACDVGPSSADNPQLIPMVEQIIANMGAVPNEVSADAGYSAEANLAALEARGIDAYVAAGRQRHGKPAPAAAQPVTPETRVGRMVAKLRDGGWGSPYHLRKVTVEPVFGQIKQARGFRQFLTRGLANVRAEWAMVCTAHNLCKLAAAR